MARATQPVQDTLQADNDIFDESTLPPARRTSAIGERLRLAREALVVSQAKFALRAGVSPIAYNQYELGKTQPAIDKVIKIRDARCLTENSYHDVRDLAAKHSLDFIERVAMPANNLSVVFARR